ncbi:MAG TPA: cyd operon YbgE family protein [Gallionellaceae bacterium]|nr:cyd operon YbgE family protein [Gallionellaceae bacterium]
MSAAAANAHRSGAAAAVLRAVSLLLAVATSGLIFTYPQALAHAGHGLLSLVMLGVCAGFVHGVGFVPVHRIWRVAFSPWVSWPLMGVGLWLVAG